MREIRRIAQEAEQKGRICRKTQTGSIRKHYTIRTGELATLLAGLALTHTAIWNPILTGAMAACTMIALVLWDAQHDYRKDAAHASVSIVQYGDVQRDAERLLEGTATGEETERAREKLDTK